MAEPTAKDWVVVYDHDLDRKAFPWKLAGPSPTEPGVVQTQWFYRYETAIFVGRCFAKRAKTELWCRRTDEDGWHVDSFAELPTRRSWLRRFRHPDGEKAGA